MARQAAAFEVGARPFAAMVEEADVVVFAFERLDFALDELVQFGKVGGDFGGDFEIQWRRSCGDIREPLPHYRSCERNLVRKLGRALGLAQSTQSGGLSTNACETLSAPPRPAN